jgi:hypothetical protein
MVKPGSLAQEYLRDEGCHQKLVKGALLAFRATDAP